MVWLLERLRYRFESGVCGLQARRSDHRKELTNYGRGRGVMGDEEVSGGGMISSIKSFEVIISPGTDATNLG